MVSAFVKAYPNLPGYHMWSTWDRLTAVSTFGPAGSEEEDDPDFGWEFSGLDDPGAMRDFMSACDHCSEHHAVSSRRMREASVHPERMGRGTCRPGPLQGGA
jgi:hypothetical protein